MMNKTVRELRALAKEKSFVGYSRMKKAELVNLLREETLEEKFIKQLPGSVELITYKDHDNWLETRKLGIGGSDVAGILGQSKYKSPVDVWDSKVNNVTFAGNRFTEWGHMLEKVVAEKFDKEHKDLEVFEFPKTMKKGYSLANVDRLLYDPLKNEFGVLEIKTANFFGGKDWSGDTVPQEYYCQVQHYLAVTELDYAYIACLVGGNDYKEFRIERNTEESAFILQACEDFWKEYVVKKQVPPVDGSDSYTKYQQELMDKVSPNEVEIEGLDLKVAEYKFIQEQIKDLERKAELIKQELADELIKKNGSLARGEKSKVKIIAKKSTSTNRELFATTYPEIFNNYKEKEKEFKVEKLTNYIKID